MPPFKPYVQSEQTRARNKQAALAKVRGEHLAELLRVDQLPNSQLIIRDPQMQHMQDMGELLIRELNKTSEHDRENPIRLTDPSEEA